MEAAVPASQPTAITSSAQRIPKGFRLKAHGREARVTLGKMGEGKQPQRGCVAAVATRHNPVGVENPARSHPRQLVPRNLGLEDTIPLGWKNGRLFQLSPGSFLRVEYPKPIGIKIAMWFFHRNPPGPRK